MADKNKLAKFAPLGIAAGVGLLLGIVGTTLFSGGGLGGSDGGLGGSDGGTPDAGRDPCANISPAVAQRISALASSNWKVMNATAGTAMFGCSGSSQGTACLTSYPSSTANPWSAAWGTVAPTTTLRVLAEYAYQSNFWTRSSADGRFVAHGGGPTGGTTIIDLSPPRTIRAQASYLPAFFPDNSGFMVSGGARPLCRQSLLASNPTQVTFNEPECSSVTTIGLNASFAAVAGGDFWAAHGTFQSENWAPIPAPTFPMTASLRLTPLFWSGTSYLARPQHALATPFEGDHSISPSATFIISRPTDGGYVLRHLDATFDGGTYDVAVPPIARYCAAGSTATFSFDERFVTYAHDVAADDWQSLGFATANVAEFTAMVGTASNIYLLDLVTGLSRPITRMNAGQRAKYPHFRSDGWLYFVVRDTTRSVENLVASDAALHF